MAIVESRQANTDEIISSITYSEGDDFAGVGFTLVKDMHTGSINLTINDGDSISIEDYLDQETGIIPPSYWERLITYLTPTMARPVVALVGPAGNGKTTAAESVCELLGYEYLVIDCNDTLEPADLVGAMTYHPQKGEIWRDGPVTAAFKSGMAIVFNEFDALNPRTAMCLQSAFQDKGKKGLSRYITTPTCPDHDKVYPEGDCPIILTMNTYGAGASGSARRYVGRNALDAATLDRITVISTTYEHEHEIVVSHGYSDDTARLIVGYASEMREKIQQNDLPIILSMRGILKMAQAHEIYGWSWDKVTAEFTGELDPQHLEYLEAKPTPKPTVDSYRPFGTRR